MDAIWTLASGVIAFFKETCHNDTHAKRVTIE